MAKFVSNISLETAHDIQFKNAAGTNTGKIESDGNNLVLSNAVGDILLGDGASDVYIGDGTNNVDILFEQSGNIMADASSSGVTITLGSSNTTMAFGGATSFADIVSAFSSTGTNTVDIGTNAKPFRDIYAAHHVGGNSINYATSRGWVEDPAPLSETQVGYFGGNFSRNGDAAENEVIRGQDPFNNKALLWKCIGNTSDDDDDGGWNKDITIPANNNIGYLSYVYFRTDFTPDAAEDGIIYLGCGTTSGQTINVSDDSSNTNPYFVSHNLHTVNNGGAAVANRWYLMVGVIQPYNDETTGTDTISGVYDVETGEKVYNGAEFKMGNNTTGQKHRAYLYYQDTTNAGNVYFWNPGFHAIDGSEPKIQDLVKRQTIATTMKVGRDKDNLIDFTTDNQMIFRLNNSDKLLLSEARLAPNSNDGMVLGSSSLMWSDLFLASGSVVNFNNGDVALTHSSNLLTLTGGGLTVGVNDTGHDVIFYGATSGKKTQWDESADTLIVDGALDVNGGSDFNSSTTNLIASFTSSDSIGEIRIADNSKYTRLLTVGTQFKIMPNDGDETVVFDGTTTTFNGTLTVGQDDTGYDVKFFGATSGKYMMWDESADDLLVQGTIKVDRLHLYTTSTDRATIQAGESGTTGHLYLNSYEGSDLHSLTWSGANNGFYPQGASGTFSLGLSGNRWSNVYTVAVTASGELEGGSLDINGNADIAGDLAISAGALSITGDGSNAVTLTESGSGDFTIDAPDDIRLDAGGGDIALKDDGSEYGRLTNSSQDFVISVSTNDKDMLFKGYDNSSVITALTLDMSEAGKAIFNSGVTCTTLIPSSHIYLGATKYLYFDGGGNTHMRESSADTLQITTGGTLALTIDSSQNTTLAGNIEMPSASRIRFGAGDALIQEGVAENYALEFQTYNGSSMTEAMRLKGDNTALFNGPVIMYDTVTVASDLIHSGDTDTKISFGTNTVTVTAGNVSNIAASATGASIPKRKLGKSGSTDGDHDGDVVYFGGTTSMEVGQIYYFTSGGAWALADADAESTAKGMLAVALGAASDTDGMLIRGFVTLDHDPGTIADTLFLHTTAGQASSTAPSGNGDIVRVIGYCIDSSNGQIYFNPDGTFVEVTA